MNTHDLNEIETLLTEPSTYTGRCAGTVLLIHNGRLNEVGQRIIGINAGRSEYVSCDELNYDDEVFLENVLRETFSKKGSLVFSLNTEPPKFLCRILREIRQEGAFRCRFAEGQFYQRVPSGCALVVLVSQSRLTTIKERYFGSLFELIERV